MRNEHIARAEVAPTAPAPPTSTLAEASKVLRSVSGNSAEVVQRSTLHVGAADDPQEREADRVASDVLRALSSAPPVATDGDAGSGRLQRSAHRTSTSAPRTEARGVRRSAIGAEGGELDAATSRTIERRRGGGSPLDGRVLQRMEHGFGADLGHVRLHTGNEASALNESMQAAAFTVGSDVFVHGSSPDVSTPAGEQLLAHEIAHTFQQGGGGQRRLRRKMMSTKAFDTSTDEGLFTQSSKAQKSIRVLLDAYHAAFPWESQMAMTSTQASTAVERLEEIRRVAKLWIADHEVDVNGTVTKDPKRVKRRAGMDQLATACESEMRVMRDLVQLKTTGGVTGADQDLTAVDITQESEAFSKVKEKYNGDALSAFRRLGFLIDGAVPVVGDRSSITMEITIPIPPGFITIEFGAEAKRDSAAKKDPQGNPIVVPGDQSRVESAMTVGVSGGASVGSIAKLSAGIGCYLSAKARTGADVTELMSYALFRRCRESILVPREVENAMWGNGRSGDFGWVKAEDWSKGVEERIFGNDDQAEVSSGVYGKLAANVEVSKDLASLGFEVKGTKGTKIDKESIIAAKGAVGAQNNTSGGGQVRAGGGPRGTTQSSLGVKNMGLETSATFAFGILSGGIKAEFGWSRSGVAVAGTPTYVFDTFKIGADLAGQMPMNKMAGDAIAALIPNLVGTINKVIRGSTQAAQAETTARTAGAITEDVGSYAAAIAELASVPKAAWEPFAANPATAGLDVGSTASVELSGSFDFKQNVLVVELRLGKSSALTNAVKAGGDVVQVFKLDISTSSRLLMVTRDSGKWALS